MKKLMVITAVVMAASLSACGADSVEYVTETVIETETVFVEVPIEVEEDKTLPLFNPYVVELSTDLENGTYYGTAANQSEDGAARYGYGYMQVDGETPLNEYNVNVHWFSEDPDSHMNIYLVHPELGCYVNAHMYQDGVVSVYKNECFEPVDADAVYDMESLNVLAGDLMVRKFYADNKLFNFQLKLATTTGTARGDTVNFTIDNYSVY